ncbi:MAG: histidine kinase, partial [Synechococcaceae bacterium WB6_3B_236]|nr:histidine kinase [Synechococcaceae bacterium WB6_3B_236]
MTTDPTSYGLRLLGVLAAVLGVQSLGAAAPQPGDALMLLSSEGAVAGLGDGLRRGFSLAQEQAQICGAKPTQWSVGWLPPGTNPAKKLRERPLPPLLLAPAAAPLVETGLLAEDRHRQILLPLQRG